MKDHEMVRLAQERGPARHRLQDALFPHLAQIFTHPGEPRHILDQRGRLVDVEVVHHEVPAGRGRVGSHRLLDVRQKVGCGTGRPHRRGGHRAGDDIEVNDERAGAVAAILERPRSGLAGPQRQVRMFALQCLHPGHFVRAHRAFSDGGAGGGFPIDGADGVNLRIALGGGVLRGGGQPVAAAVGLEGGFLLKNAPDAGARSGRSDRGGSPPPRSLAGTNH